MNVKTLWADGVWCCKRSVRYGGRPVCNALKVKVASLNCMRHSSGSQWSCLRSSLEENGVRERLFTTTLAFKLLSVIPEL